MFVGLKGLISNKVHFGAFWSKVGLGMNLTCLEHKEWTKLET